MREQNYSYTHSEPWHQMEWADS